MPATKTVPQLKTKKRLMLPESVRDDPQGSAMWAWANKCYRFVPADRLALTMLCHAWSQYCKHYEECRKGESGGKGEKATTPMTAWYDRVTKMMFCLGMMPSQRGGSGGGMPDSGIGPLETRGGDEDFGDGE